MAVHLPAGRVSCHNPQYAEELEENEKKIAEGAWATSLDLSRIKFWYRLLMRYCPNHPLTESLKRERENLKRRKDFADFFFWIGTDFHGHGGR